MIDFDTNIYYLDKKAVLKVEGFIENFITHVKGELAGQKIKLEKWQKEDIIRPAFGIKRKSDGLRRFRTVYIEVPRKNAKSTILAGVGLYLLLADGEKGAEIYSAAGDRDQARIIFDIAAGMVYHNEELLKRCRVFQYTIKKKTDLNYYRVISAEAKTKHGFNAHGILFDELHTQPDRELWDVLTTSVGSRRQPLIIAITTAGYDKESICYEIHEYAKKVKEGVIKDDSFLPVIYSAPMDADIFDINVWKLANPGFGTIVKEEYIREQVNKIRNQPSFESTFRRLHLNQWVGTAETWIPDDVWMTNASEPLCEGPCYAGLDLSTVGDISAFVLFFSQSLSVLPFFFVPSEKVEERSRKEGVNYDVWVREGKMISTPGNILDYDYVMKTMIECKEKYDIREIGYDRWGIKDLSNKFDRNQVDLDKWPIFPVGQGFASMSEPTKNLERMATASKLRHGGHPVLRWMVSNVGIEDDAAGNIKISKRKSREKIDGVAALIDALVAWGGREPAFRSRYEDNAELEVI